MEIDFEKYLQQVVDWAVGFAPRLLAAIFVLFIGFWLVRRMARLIELSMEKANLSTDIRLFLMSLIDILLKFVVLLIAAGIMGFEVSSLLGILAAAGFAIGLALQGFLGNFAAGITIVFFKPYRVGDWVEISEKFGKVSSIQIFNTIIVTPGNKTLIIPNGQVTDHIITNYSARGKMRLELEIPIPYQEDYPRIKSILEKVLNEADFIIDEKDSQIGIARYESHSITIYLRPYIHPDNYWEATFHLHERIKKAFHDNSVPIAYSEGIELGEIGA